MSFRKVAQLLALRRCVCRWLHCIQFFFFEFQQSSTLLRSEPLKILLSWNYLIFILVVYLHEKLFKGALQNRFCKHLKNLPINVHGEVKKKIVNEGTNNQPNYIWSFLWTALFLDFHESFRATLENYLCVLILAFE